MHRRQNDAAAAAEGDRRRYQAADKTGRLHLSISPAHFFIHLGGEERPEAARHRRGSRSPRCALGAWVQLVPMAMAASRCSTHRMSPLFQSAAASLIMYTNAGRRAHFP